MSINVVLLAAGLSKRMGGINKLLTPVNGKPLILYSVENALSYSSSVYVVSGNEREKVENILSSYPVNIIYNQSYHEGQDVKRNSMAMNVQEHSTTGKQVIQLLSAEVLSRFTEAIRLTE